MMMDADVHEAAVARWLALGMSSRTHPVLRFALESFLRPVGIEAVAIEAEPFGALESGSNGWWLHEPTWNAALVERGTEREKDFGYLLEAPESFAVTVGAKGLIAITVKPGDLAAEAFMISSKGGWVAARHGLRAAAEVEAFLFGGACLLLNDGRLASLYLSGDDAAFCAEVQRKVGG